MLKHAKKQWLAVLLSAGLCLSLLSLPLVVGQAVVHAETGDVGDGGTSDSELPPPPPSAEPEEDENEPVTVDEDRRDGEPAEDAETPKDDAEAPKDDGEAEVESPDAGEHQGDPSVEEKEKDADPSHTGDAEEEGEEEAEERGDAEDPKADAEGGEEKAEEEQPAKPELTEAELLARQEAARALVREWLNKLVSGSKTTVKAEHHLEFSQFLPVKPVKSKLQIPDVLTFQFFRPVKK